MKKHLRKYHVQYIIGFAVLYGSASLAWYYRTINKNYS